MGPYLIILNTNEPEVVWNALRISYGLLSEGHKVKLFLLGKAVETEAWDTAEFDIYGLVSKFLDGGGEFLL